MEPLGHLDSGTGCVSLEDWEIWARHPNLRLTSPEKLLNSTRLSDVTKGELGFVSLQLGDPVAGCEQGRGRKPREQKAQGGCCGCWVPPLLPSSPSVVTSSYQALPVSFLPFPPSTFLYLSLGFEPWIQFVVLTVGSHRSSLIHCEGTGRSSCSYHGCFL